VINFLKESDMVLYDDKKWLCRLIRTAFTIDDDSGEMFMILFRNRIALFGSLSCLIY